MIILSIQRQCDGPAPHLTCEAVALMEVPLFVDGALAFLKKGGEDENHKHVDMPEAQLALRAFDAAVTMMGWEAIGGLGQLHDCGVIERDITPVRHIAIPHTKVWVVCPFCARIMTEDAKAEIRGERRPILTAQVPA